MFRVTLRSLTSVDAQRHQKVSDVLFLKHLEVCRQFIITARTPHGDASSSARAVFAGDLLLLWQVQSIVRMIYGDASHLQTASSIFR